jgi:N-methylhydantoinase A
MPALMTGRYRLGVDIGGTFTDAVLIDERSGAAWIDKVPTMPADPSIGFLAVVRRLVERVGLRPCEIGSVLHATTVATNAVIERRGAPAAMLLTRGFRDVLEIQRQVRWELYNLQTEKPRPLIPRRRCIEIAERLDYRGRVATPLDESAVAVAAERLREERIDSIAVCFLHAYQNPAHERRAAEIVRRHHPAALLSLSSEIAPEIREYWRASTTAANAYVAPVVSRYLGAIEEQLRQAGVTAGVQIVQSSGGIMSAATAKQRPIQMIESGPAAGVAAAAYLARLVGFEHAISFDMGGTTAKMGLILDQTPRVLAELEVGGAAGSGTGLVKGSGYPILTPTVDLVEVGTGGGSLGWIDSGGVPRVGPTSAGADPGPACYGGGGTGPTVTDANLVLGRLNPDYFLGGEIRLDVDAARRAIEEGYARPLGIDPVQAASGIVEIANAAMVQAMRRVTVQRGYDPRELSLVAFGGAGPVHANALAAELGVPAVVIPPGPGVASALGMLVSDLRHDYRVTRIQPLAEADLGELEAIFRRFEAAARAELAGEGVPPDRIRLDRLLDVRYRGQSWKLPVPVPPGALSAADLPAIKQAFDRLHEQAYGYGVPTEPAEIVTVALAAVGLIPKPSLKEPGPGGPSPAAAARGVRPVYFAEAGGFTDTAIYDRYALRTGNLVSGPAIVEELDSSAVIQPGFVGEVGRFGVLLVRRAEQAERWACPGADGTPQITPRPVSESLTGDRVSRTHAHRDPRQ